MKISRFFLHASLGAVLLLLSACTSSSPSGKSGAGESGGDAASGGDDAAGSGEAEGEEADSEWGLDLSIPEGTVQYGVYVGANVTGHCDPYANSGGFESMTFDSVFNNVVFVQPNSGAAGAVGTYGGIYKADVAGSVPMVGIGITGEGKIGDFTLCPQYEEEEGCGCHVTNGPHPFEPVLSLLPAEPDYMPNTLLGTEEPYKLGVAILHYSIGATKDLGPIMEWAGCVGSGALGGSLEPVDVTFVVSWDQLMMGEEFASGAVTGGERETWEWSIRFMPWY
jgi:hypothetical protein